MMEDIEVKVVLESVEDGMKRKIIERLNQTLNDFFFESMDGLGGIQPYKAEWEIKAKSISGCKGFAQAGEQGKLM